MTDIDLNAITDEAETLALHSAVSVPEHSTMIRRLVAEVAKIEGQRDEAQRERDQYAAVIDVVAAIVDSRKALNGNDAVMDVRVALAQLPPATLAARDAERKAEGWDEGAAQCDSRWRKVTANPYRTPQQGEPE